MNLENKILPANTINKFVTKFKKWLDVENSSEYEESSDDDFRIINSSENEENDRQDEAKDNSTIKKEMNKNESSRDDIMKSKSKGKQRKFTKENNDNIREKSQKNKIRDILKNHKIRISSKPNVQTEKDNDNKTTANLTINRKDDNENSKYEYFYKNNIRIKLPKTLIEKLTHDEIDAVIEELCTQKKILNNDVNSNDYKERNNKMKNPNEECSKLQKLRRIKENVMQNKSENSLFKINYVNENKEKMEKLNELFNHTARYQDNENKSAKYKKELKRDNDCFNKFVKETQIKEPRIILEPNPEKILKVHNYKTKNKRSYSIESSTSESKSSESSSENSCDKSDRVKIKLKRRHPKSLDIIHNCTKDLYYNYTDNNLPGTSKFKTRTELINEYLNSITNDLVDGSKETVPKDPLTRPSLGASGMYPTKKWISELKSRGITPVPGKHYKIVKKKSKNKTVLNDFWKSKKK